jgi:hypothetical protein
MHEWIVTIFHKVCYKISTFLLQKNTKLLILIVFLIVKLSEKPWCIRVGSVSGVCYVSAFIPIAGIYFLITHMLRILTNRYSPL